MIGRAYLLVLVFIAVIAVVNSGGFNYRALFIFSFVAVLLGISYYFNSRKSIVPSSYEKIVASIWLFIRRLVCFSAAIFFGGLAILFMFFSKLTFQNIGASLAFIAVTAFCIWVGVYGQGWKRTDWKDDVALHEKNKIRYKWPW